MIKYSIPYGSIVYGTCNELSDINILKIVSDDSNPDEHIYTRDEYQTALNNHEIIPLETYFYAKQNFNEFPFEFTLDKWKLRQVFSRTASNSWVKCKKKLQDGERYKGLKSLFHSMRILMYGVNIANKNNLELSNSLILEIYKIIISIPEDWTWKQISSEFKEGYNILHSELVKLCPKPLEVN